MQTSGGQTVQVMAGLSLSPMIYGGSVTCSEVSCNLIVHAQHFMIASQFLLTSLMVI